MNWNQKLYTLILWNHFFRGKKEMQKFTPNHVGSIFQSCATTRVDPLFKKQRNPSEQSYLGLLKMTLSQSIS